MTFLIIDNIIIYDLSDISCSMVFGMYHIVSFKLNIRYDGYAVGGFHHIGFYCVFFGYNFKVMDHNYNI